jgi:hypothetical protein
VIVDDVELHEGFRSGQAGRGCTAKITVATGQQSP